MVWSNVSNSTFFLKKLKHIKQMAFIMTLSYSFICLSSAHIGACIEVRGHLSGSSSLLALCGSRRLNSSSQPWQQAPFSVEPSCLPHCDISIYICHYTLLLFVHHSYFSTTFRTSPRPTIPFLFPCHIDI